MKKDIVGLVALIILVIGGINWGLIGIANINLVTRLFSDAMIVKIIYDLVGVSALYVIYATWLKK